jgi:hypothetical protein
MVSKKAWTPQAYLFTHKTTAQGALPYYIGINGMQWLQGNALQGETPSSRLSLFPRIF